MFICIPAQRKNQMMMAMSVKMDDHLKYCLNIGMDERLKIKDERWTLKSVISTNLPAGRQV